MSDQRLQTRGGERWPGNDVQSEMRRDGPAVQAADVPARQPRATGPRDGGAGDRSQVLRLRPGPKAVDRRPAIRKERSGCLKGKSTGGDAEQTYKHRARDAIGLGGLAVIRTSTSLYVARRRPCVRWTLGVPRALGSFAAAVKHDGLPGAAKNRGDFACAFLIPSLKREGPTRSTGELRIA